MSYSSSVPTSKPVASPSVVAQFISTAPASKSQAASPGARTKIADSAAPSRSASSDTSASAQAPRLATLPTTPAATSATPEAAFPTLKADVPTPDLAASTLALIKSGGGKLVPPALVASVLSGQFDGASAAVVPSIDLPTVVRAEQTGLFIGVAVVVGALIVGGICIYAYCAGSARGTADANDAADEAAARAHRRRHAHTPAQPQVHRGPHHHAELTPPPQVHRVHHHRHHQSSSRTHHHTTR